MKGPSTPFLLAVYALMLLLWWISGFAPEHDQTARIAYFFGCYVVVVAGMLLVQCCGLLACRRTKYPRFVRFLLPLLALGVIILLKPQVGFGVRWLEDKLQSICEPAPGKAEPVSRGMMHEIPRGWKVEQSGQDLYATTPELAGELRRIITRVRAETRALTGRDTPLRAQDPGWTRIYYAATREDYAALYWRITGHSPASMGGMTEFAPRPPRIFGCEEVGGGSIGHEMVHVLIMRDWPTIPGWFNEALAQALGASNQSQRASRIARVAWAADRWIPLEDVALQQDSDYSHLTRNGRLVSHGGWEGTMNRLITGHAFVWWLHETGRLSTFYRAIRDTRNVTSACQAIGLERIQDAEQLWLTWLKAQEGPPGRDRNPRLAP